MRDPTTTFAYAFQNKTHDRQKSNGREETVAEPSGMKSNAEESGVAEQVRFVRADLFTADLSQFDVITTYLTPRQIEQLIPRLQKLKPGARVVSHYFLIPGFKPDETIEIPSATRGQNDRIHLWKAAIRTEMSAP